MSAGIQNGVLIASVGVATVSSIAALRSAFVVSRRITELERRHTIAA